MLKKIKHRYNWGGRFLTNKFQVEIKQKSVEETAKEPLRSEIINFLLQSLNRETTYLEIGVRNPDHNFNKINADQKYSVDPGVEFKENPVDFKMTSDAFFSALSSNELLSNEIRFDVIFIDGLHLADQVERDIENALKFIKDDGFILLHDCNPPSEWHAREEYYYDLTPAGKYWNGTTWKAFYKMRFDSRVTSTCIDSDWGVGILTRRNLFNSLENNENSFYEFRNLDANRKEHLNLISFDELKAIMS